MKRSKKSLSRLDWFIPLLIRKRLLVRSLGAALLAATCALALLHPAAAAPSHALTPKGYKAVLLPSAWVHTATTANTTSSWTDLDSPVTNNHPEAVVFVTPHINDLPTPNVGVWYNRVTNRWSIYNENNSPMQVGAAFNVQVWPWPNSSAFVFTATTATLSADGSSADIRNPYTDQEPDPILMVTPTWNGLDDNHPLGVFYHYETGHWALFHEDGAPISPGAAYNIGWYPSDSYHYVHTSTTSNIFWANTELNNPALNGNPRAIVLVTNRWTEKHCFQTTFGPICVWPTPLTYTGLTVQWFPADPNLGSWASWAIFRADWCTECSWNSSGALYNIIIAATTS